MRKFLFAALMVAVLSASNVRAQDDPQAVISAAAQTLGVANLNSVEYTGTGTVNTFGQSWKHDVQWPEFKLTSYTLDIDYKKPAMRVDLTRDNPDKGTPMQGGGYPLAAPQHIIQALNGKIAWNTIGQTVTSDLAAAADRTLELWSTPQGVIKAAQAAGSSVKAQTMKNAQGEIASTVLTFPVGSTMFKATVTKDNVVSRVEYTSDTAMLGDTVTTVLYSGYKDYDGVKFPGRMVRLQGGVPAVGLDSYQTLTLVINKVVSNPAVTVDVPPSVQQIAAAPPAVPVATVEKIADGIYLVSGQGPSSVAVEFSDYIFVVEAPVGDAVVKARFDAIRKAIPNKPIKFVVSTHHHFDHAGGIRAAVAEGATLIVPGWSRVLYDKVMAAPHTLNPDLLAKQPQKPNLEDVGTAFGSARDMLEFTDGKRTLRVYRVLGSQEADAMLFVYLPVEKMLIEADMYSPNTQNPAAASDAPAAKPGRAAERPLILTPEPLILYNNIKRLALDVDIIVPLHGRPVKMQELLATIGDN